MDGDTEKAIREIPGILVMIAAILALQVLMKACL